MPALKLTGSTRCKCITHLLVNLYAHCFPTSPQIDFLDSLFSQEDISWLVPQKVTEQRDAADCHREAESQAEG